MKIIKIKTLNEAVTELDSKNYGVMSHNLADALRDEKENKKKVADMMVELSKTVPMEDRDDHTKGVKTPALKKMHLAESLFEEWDENDSLNESWNEDLIHDVYNSLADIAFDYHQNKNVNLTVRDFEPAWEWFATHFEDNESLNEKWVSKEFPQIASKLNILKNEWVEIQKDFLFNKLKPLVEEWEFLDPENRKYSYTDKNNANFDEIRVSKNGKVKTNINQIPYGGRYVGVEDFFNDAHFANIILTTGTTSAKWIEDNEELNESINGNTSHAQDFISALRSAGFGDGFDQKLKIDTYGNGGTRVEYKDQGGNFVVTITDDKVVLEGQDEGDTPFKKEFSTWEEFASEFESLYPGIPVRENKILVEASQNNDINKLYFKWSGDREWFSFAPYMEGISEEDDTWNWALESAWDESEGGDGAAFNDEALDLGYKGVVDKSLNTELDDNQIYDQILQKGYYDLFGYTKEEWESLKGNPIETIVVSGREIPVASFNKEKYGDLSSRALQVLKSYKELKEEPLNESSYTRSDNKKMLVKPNRDPLVDVIQLTLTDGEWGYVQSPDGTVTPSLLPHLSYPIDEVGVSFDNNGRYFVRAWDSNEEALQKVAEVAKQFNREYKIGFDKYRSGNKWYCLIYLNENTDFDDPYVDPEAEVNKEGIKGRGTKLRGNPEARARHARDNEDLEDCQRYPIESPQPAQTGLLSEDISVNGSLMEDKISTDMIHDFKPEKGAAEETFNRVLEAGKMETFEFMLEDRFPNGVTTEELNKILSEESQWVYDQLGMKEYIIPDEDEE